MSVPTSPGAQLVPRGEGRFSLDGLAAQADLPPDLVRRLVGLGLIEPCGGTRADPLFRRQDADREWHQGCDAVG